MEQYIEHIISSENIENIINKGNHQFFGLSK